jgi:hypothetical protein
MPFRKKLINILFEPVGFAGRAGFLIPLSARFAQRWGLDTVSPSRFRPTIQVSGPVLVRVPGKPDFGLLGWLERFAQDQR